MSLLRSARIVEPEPAGLSWQGLPGSSTHPATAPVLDLLGTPDRSHQLITGSLGPGPNVRKVSYDDGINRV
jgi:hypothetical protein